MYNIIDKTRRLSGRIALGAALFAASLLPISCSDDLLYNDDIYMNEDGTFGPFDLSVKIDAEGSDSKTRSGFGTDGFQINNVWLAMFDSESGQLLAVNNNDFTGPIEDNSQVTDHGQAIADRTCRLNSIMFSNKTKTAYIVAVANTKGVMAVDKDGEYWELDSVLNHIQNSVDFKNVIVDNSSAERAMGDTGNAPLMSGVWGTQHFNYTMNLGGKVYGNVATPASGVADEYALITLYDSNLKVSCKEKVESGMVHLRRLYAHINVNVDFDTDYFTSIEDPSVEVCNMPRYTFLQEHKTVENSEAYDATVPDANGRTWKDATHTGAHLIPGSSLESTGIITPDQTKNFYANPEEATFVMNEEDKVSFDGKNLKFGYWHYETKHWGLDNVKSVNDREKMFDGGKYFTSLCPSTDKTFNNDAPYFVVRAKVKTKDGYQGNAEFVVHEGYCCSPNSNASSDEAVIARDFCTFRNTNYNYTVSIQGINGYKLKVQSEDFSGDGYYGAGGEMWREDPNSIRSVKMPKTGGDYSLTIPGTASGMTDFYWAITEDGTNYWGHKIPDSDNWAKERFPYFTNLNVTEGANTNSVLYKAISVNYNGTTVDLQGLNAIRGAEDINATIHFDGQESVNGELYLCAIYTSADRTSKFFNVIKLSQNGLELAQPQLTMPGAPTSGPLILGIDDHTVYWAPVKGAQSYTITLQETGYSRTLVPGEEIDDNGYKIKINEEGNNMLSFRIRYANSQGGILNLFPDQNTRSTQTGTIVVVANGPAGATSDPGTIQRTYSNPVWDFNTTDWQNAVATLTKDNSGATGGLAVNQSITVYGLTMFTGSNNKMTYLQYGSGTKVYGFRPNGTSNLNSDKTAVDSRAFSFNAFANGKINVWTSAQGNSANQKRYIRVAQRNAGGTLDEYVDSNDATASVAGTLTKIPDIPIDPASRIAPNTYVYNTGDLIYYKILFTPQDR